jgi:hypothetical protein
MHAQGSYLIVFIVEDDVQLPAFPIVWSVDSAINLHLCISCQCCSSHCVRSSFRVAGNWTFSSMMHAQEPLSAHVPLGGKGSIGSFPAKLAAGKGTPLLRGTGYGTCDEYNKIPCNAALEDPPGLRWTFYWLQSSENKSLPISFPSSQQQHKENPLFQESNGNSRLCAFSESENLENAPARQAPPMRLFLRSINKKSVPPQLNALEPTIAAC